jgi:integrase
VSVTDTARTMFNYETAARADEVLRLDVEDLDIAPKRARTRSNSGDVDWLFCGSGSARRLPRLIAAVAPGRCSCRACARWTLHQFRPRSAHGAVVAGPVGRS